MAFFHVAILLLAAYFSADARPAEEEGPLIKSGTATVFVGGNATQTQPGKMTNYCSYPPCCETSGINYSNAERQICPGDIECTEYNGCQWEGQFAYCRLTRQQVLNDNVIAFFATTNNGRYAGKNIRVTQGSRSMTAVACDTCGDSDCDGCCTRNAQPHGFLIDVESNTYVRAGFSNGDVQWECLSC